MAFSENIKLFLKKKKLTNRDLSKLMGGYSESMISQFINSDKISSTFLNKLVETFPDIDMNKLIYDHEKMSVVQEEAAVYNKRSAVLVQEISERFEELKNILSRN